MTSLKKEIYGVSLRLPVDLANQVLQSNNFTLHKYTTLNLMHSQYTFCPHDVELIFSNLLLDSIAFTLRPDGLAITVNETYHVPLQKYMKYIHYPENNSGFNYTNHIAVEHTNEVPLEPVDGYNGVARIFFEPQGDSSGHFSRYYRDNSINSTYLDKYSRFRELYTQLKKEMEQEEENTTENDEEEEKSLTEIFNFMKSLSENMKALKEERNRSVNMEEHDTQKEVQAQSSVYTNNILDTNTNEQSIPDDHQKLREMILRQNQIYHLNSSDPAYIPFLDIPRKSPDAFQSSSDDDVKLSSKSFIITNMDSKKSTIYFEKGDIYQKILNDENIKSKYSLNKESDSNDDTNKDDTSSVSSASTQSSTILEYAVDDKDELRDLGFVPIVFHKLEKPNQNIVVLTDSIDKELLQLLKPYFNLADSKLN